MTSGIHATAMTGGTLLAMLLLGGCATFSADGGFGAVQAITQERMGVTPSPPVKRDEAFRVAGEVERLLAEPLTADAAVKIALLNNRGLQASYAELGIAEADLVQAGRLRNPVFSYQSVGGGGVSEYERQFFFDLLGLLTMPTRREIEGRRFETAQIRVASEVLRLAQHARQTFFSAVAAQEAVNYFEQAQSAAQAGAELAARMAEVGNFSRLRQQREQAFYAEVTADLARARQASVRDRERLIRLLGLTGAQGFTLPERLPGLPAATLAEKDIAQRAMDARLDVRMAKRELEGLAKNLGLNQATRFINVLEISYLNNKTTGEERQQGYEIELSLPIFDWGGARVAKAEAMYTQAMNRVAEIAVNAESEVREAYHAYRTAHDLARHYRDEIVPLRKRISEENLLRYNGMLIGVWELLADARQQVASVNTAIQALKDYWIAESNLQMSINGIGAGNLPFLAGGTAMAAESAGEH